MPTLQGGKLSEQDGIRLIRIEDILEPAFPLRSSLDAIQELAQSIESLGLLSPILLRRHPSIEGKFQLIAGQRRLAALKALGNSYAEAKIIEETGADLSLIYSITENLQRKDISDYEKAKAFHILNVRFGKRYREIGALIGKSESYVANHVAMLNILEGLKSENDRLEAEESLASLSEHHVRLILRTRDPQRRLNIAKTAVRMNLCVRELNNLIGREWVFGSRDDSPVTMTKNSINSQKGRQYSVRLTVKTSYDLEKLKMKIKRMLRRNNIDLLEIDVQ